MQALPRLIDGRPCPGHIRLGTAPEVLQEIDSPGVNLAIWERPHKAELYKRSFDALVDSKRFQSFAYNSGTLRLPLCTKECLPDISFVTNFLQKRLAGIEIIASDLLDLMKAYAQTLKPKERIEVSIRLSYFLTLTSSFHTDGGQIRNRETHRLISTYYGSPTDWLENDGADFSGPTTSASSDAFVHSMGTGNVACMKNGYHGIFHRSPIKHETKARVLTVMDAVP